MQKFSSVLSNFNKLPIIRGLKFKPPKMQQALSITSLQLNQFSIPRQPVPDMKKTAEKYLISLKPLLNEEEFSNTEKIVNHFISENGPGPILYKKLQERYDKTENWMNKWWLREAYLGYRTPVIVHSSPGIISPQQNFQNLDEMHSFVARLIEGVCKYDAMVKSGKIKQEMVRNEPLDMLPYGMILGTHRQPNRKVDNLLHTDFANHIIIISNNRIFKVNLLHCNKPLTENQLKSSIKDIVNRSNVPGKPIGILTGNDRDTWAENHEILKEIGSNGKILKDIESSLFVLCLDKQLPNDAFKTKNNESVRSVQSMTGYSSSTNSGNRWHDKTLQYIISCDGFVGLEYEHSPCEGGPVAVLHDFALNNATSKMNIECEEAKDFPQAEELNFELNDKIEKAIKEATIAVDKTSANTDMECFTFKDFGTDVIKKCKFSPDSFIQIAMQVTFYKLQKKPPAHYESAGLRRFINARTECIRSTSCESVEFAKLVNSNCDNISEKKKALINAINMHKKTAGEAAMGEGVDRFFFGLKMIANDEKMEMPEFFKDIGWTRSTSFTLTSSQVPFKSASVMCYGPVTPNGYGCCYNPRKDDILFACSSMNDSPETCTKSFAETLQDSLRLMKKIAQE
ncbi:carnitine O-acetyltransferase-like [Leptopilina boulardi]|uniref:carnitine O-acetyltransferase-like n=1 Tax=Leptopilina boulardi TaxID=63433 RepID=UPI0021F66C82|nr:carnitine O-acetyltransferase-like [Leptopilina boulardi]XP_051166863.1 carnitine O-acetyltransferase-like [Leptopilina boulardi]XP_051166864.1 carnitine O-acetyltransferase-like [Leptopilina boulardi]